MAAAVGSSLHDVVAPTLDMALKEIGRLHPFYFVHLALTGNECSMNRPSRRTAANDPIHTYNDGLPYSAPRGRSVERDQVERRPFKGHSIVRGRPTSDQFQQVVIRELKIRGYSPNSISSYKSSLRCFLAWFGNQPNLVTSEDVRNWLELLVDGGASSSHLSVNLCAIRTAFDKLCQRDVTLGLATPKKKKKQPTVLSQEEVSRVLNAAPSFSIKLAIGIMYAAGLRNSELCRLRIRDLDFDRGTIFVSQGKGRSDRIVMLPKSFESALKAISENSLGEDFLFPTKKIGETRNRHLSSRTLQRWVKLCVELAGIKKVVTPHSFRHSFATHLLENGTDIRFIQKLLGHQRLETTTIYTKVARVQVSRVESPLDQLKAADGSTESAMRREASEAKQQEPRSSVGSLAIEFLLGADEASAEVTLRIRGAKEVELSGISVRQNDRNWIEIQLPVVDQWSEPLSRLPRAQRQRIQSPEFYDQLHRQITQRFVKLLPPSSG